MRRREQLITPYNPASVDDISYVLSKSNAKPRRYVILPVNEIDISLFWLAFYIGRHPGAHAMCNVPVAYVAQLYGTYRYVSITAPALIVSL